MTTDHHPDPHPPIAPAAVVQLRAGGPPMTVSRLGRNDGAESAWCVWFENAKSHAGAFPLHALEALLPDPPNLEEPPPEDGCEALYCRAKKLRIEVVIVSPKHAAPEEPAHDDA